MHARRAEPPGAEAGLHPHVFADFVTSGEGTGLIVERTITGASHVNLFQPHPDDVALSVGGLLFAFHGRVTLHSIFSESPYAGVRRREDLAFAEKVAAEIYDHQLSENSGETNVDFASTGVIFGPAAISRHPDHIASRSIAIRAGAIALWEDVAFWGIYAQSVDDRFLAMNRDSTLFNGLVILSIRVTVSLRAKIDALKLYESQSKDIWRVIRYAWTAGYEARDAGEYHERLFVKTQNLDEVMELLKLEYVSNCVVHYGGRSFQTNVVQPRSSC